MTASLFSSRARDRIEERPTDYHQRVREGYRKAAADAKAGDCSYYPAPIALIDATGDPADVSGRIRIEVERALALEPRA